MPGQRAKRSVPIEDDTVETLQEPLEQLPQLFSVAQQTTASHRKHINTLHSLFLRCAKVITLSKDKTQKQLSGERAFGQKFREAVIYPLGVKKGVEQGDRIVKFIAGFVAFSVDYDFKQREGREEEEDEDEEDDGPASRLVSQLLSFLLRGFQAKNKIARYRCVQLVALMINNLGEIDDDSFQHLKNALLDRVHDKESSVRLQAVVALSKLQEADEDEEEEDSDDEEEAKKSVSEVLIDIMNHDSAAEVRRAALMDLFPTPETLPALLRRTLDVDTVNRRLTFTHVLPSIQVKHLSIAQREQIMSRGLRDREEAVQRAAKKLIGLWADQAGGIEEFIKLFDAYGEEGGKVAEKAVEALVEVRGELFDGLEFGDDFFQSLTPATAFLARVYFSYLRTESNPLLADLEPVVTALAFFIQAEWTQLVVLLESEERREDREAEHEFIVRQLVGMAMNLDYGDEIGRRKMFELMREMLQHSSLPQTLIPQCLDVLLKGTSERDFMRIVVEIVQSLRRDSQLVTSDSELSDEEEEDSSSEDEDGEGGNGQKRNHRRRKSKSPEQLEKRKELDLRCLIVVKALLERVMSALQENSMLHGLVAELIVPAVKTKDFEVRAQGLICLGLCCLLDKSMALDSFQLLARQSEVTEGELQVKILQTLFDLIILHGVNFGEERGFGVDVILGLLSSSLDQEDPRAAATAVVGISKLILSGMVTDEEILSRLVLLYFAGETVDNQELRQCLSYFFPIYCYSNPQNQRRVSNVVVKTLEVLRSVYDELKDKSSMVTPLQIGSQLVDWTDSQKAVNIKGVKPDETIQLDLAITMTKALYKSEEKDERKLWCQLLPKLHIPEDSDALKIKALTILISELKENRPLGDAVPHNALNRFETSLNKVFSDRLEALTDEQIDSSEAVKAVKAFIDRCEQDGDGSTEDGEDAESEDEDEDVEDDEEEEEEVEEEE
ncbi:condensin subunit YCG1 [Sporobolomyces salmoneus]|uniref:condensin subunit YCG1 n=1 Tax=Sporobolomyces salmoneus TaxID=183962 RepID=UPI00316EC84A